MEKILVASYLARGSEINENFFDKVMLNFPNVSVEYVTQKDEGMGEVAITFGRNIEGNIEA